MTNEEINKAIAEVCGWTHFKLDVRGAGAPDRRPSWSGTPPRKAYNCQLPNFSGSLDAMAEARKTLTEGEQVRYTHELLCRTTWLSKHNHPSDQEIRWDIANATAAQHAEAFLRVRGLWKD